MAPIRDKVPDWLLERLAAGELPRAQAAELRTRLVARGEEHRLSALAEADADILAALPPKQVVAEIERRAAIPARAGRPRVTRHLRPVWALSVVTACAAGLVAVLAVRDHGAVTGFSPGEPEVIGIKGDLNPALRIYRKTSFGAELLRPHAPVHEGDTLQIRYLAAGKHYGVIASVDARGTVTYHLPEAPGPAAALAHDGERALPHAYELDDSPGFERFIFVTSDAPFTTAEIARAIASGHALPTPLVWFELALKKEPP